MIETYDTRSIEKKINSLFHSVRPVCLHCQEVLDFIPNKIFGVDIGGYWGHKRYCVHNHCPLYADVSIRPNPITTARSS